MRRAEQSTFFELLSPELQARLAAAGRPRRYSCGQMVQQAGDRDPRLTIVTRGRVRAFTLDADGREISLDILEPGEALGQLTVLADLPRRVHAAAAEDSEVLEISHGRFHEVLDEDPELRRAVLRNLALSAVLALEAVEDERRLPLVGRVAKTLPSLAIRRSGDGVTVPMSQADLADYFGVSRVSMGKALGRLALAGAVSLGYGKVMVVAADRLRAFVT
jgi:CRP/FNR family transcriptional regulator